MKVSTILSVSALYAAATAWEAHIHTRANKDITLHGKTGVKCNTINWKDGSIKQDLDYIDFDPTTAFWEDATKLIFYPGQLCGAGGVAFFGGINRPNKGFWVGSYSVIV